MSQKDKKRKLFLIIKWIFYGLVIVSLGILFYLPGYSKIKKLKFKNRLISEKISKLEEEIESLEDKYNRLDYDNALWEQMVRENLGLARDKEIVIEFKEE